MRREQEALRARNADRPRGYKRLLPEKVKKTRGEGVLPIMAYTWRFRPKGVVVFTLEVNGMVRILLVEVYRRLRKSVIWVCERAQKG